MARRHGRGCREAVMEGDWVPALGDNPDDVPNQGRRDFERKRNEKVGAVGEERPHPSDPRRR